MRKFQIWGRLKIFEESWIEWTWVNGFHRFGCPKPSKGSAVKVKRSQQHVFNVYLKWAFSASLFDPWLYRNVALGMPSPTGARWHSQDQMTLEQTLHREGHAVTPMNVQLAMAIRSLAEEPWLFGGCGDLWPQRFLWWQDVSESFRLVTLLHLLSRHIMSYPCS